MKIYDCFTFYNELDLLEIRLNELNDVVDGFILVEAERSHQNKPKALFFQENKNRYEKFLHKIKHVIVPANAFVDNDAWYNENLQRSAICSGLDDIANDDLLIISDLDEIPSKEAVNFSFSKNIFPCCFWQILHYYYLNTIVSQGGNELNSGSVGMTKSEFIKNTNACRDPNYKWGKNITQIKNAGWHFSFLGNADHMLNKIQNYAHAEFNHISKDQSTDRINNLKDPLGRENFSMRVCEDLSYLPVYVKENAAKFSHLLK
jgi:beta-1,4-mannosyl-glycoprotein beta-1,4-N-acetylglucosaminyltransferase